MKKQLFCLFTLFILISCSYAQKMTGSSLKVGQVADIDGNVYKTVKIGDQWWMAENLKVTRYRNGDEIPEKTDDDEWDSSTGGRCSYKNDSANFAIYGALYNWFAVNDSRILAPEGWHVPTDEEWQELIDNLGGDTLAGGKMKSTGTIKNGDGLWRGSDENTTNESGFSALPGGYRYSHGVFDGVGSNAYFWSATESRGGNAWYRYLYYGTTNVYRDDSDWRQAGYSIRCVADSPREIK
jgi:uncharacterized protein (TIGR02145 family)